MIRAIAVLVLAVATTTSQPPSPAPAKAGQKHEQQATPKQEEAASNDKASNNPLSTVTQSIAVVTTGEQPKRGKVNERDTPIDWRLVYDIFNTTMLTVFTGALAWLAHRQHQAMKRQAMLMRGQLKEMKTTSADTRTLALAAKDAAAAAQQQSRWAALNTEAVVSQSGALIQQASIMLIQTEVLHMSVEAARDGVRTTLRQLEAYERPWVKASIEISSELSFINGDARLFITPVMTNVGKSVATNIGIAAELIAVPQGSHGYHNVLKERLAALNRPATDEEGVALFPGEVNDRETDVYFVPKADIEAFGHERNGIKYVAIAFIGAIYYRFATSESDHRTRFVYMLSFRGTPLSPDIQVGATLTSGDIHILRHSNFDSAT